MWLIHRRAVTRVLASVKRLAYTPERGDQRKLDFLYTGVMYN